MKDSTSYRVGKNLAILLVGDQKTGKTNLAAAFPNPYFLDLDKNLDSAVRVLGTKKFWYDTPANDAAGNAVPSEKVYADSMTFLKAAAVHPEIETIVIDSLSTLTIHMCEHILAEASRIERKTIDKLRIQDYGSVLSLLQRLVAFLRATNKLIVVTSHQSWDKDDVTGAIRYTLAVPGQMKHNLGAFFTDVWGTQVEQIGGGKVRYIVRTQPTGFHVALGTSIRTMPSTIDITNKSPAEVWTTLAPLIGYLPPSPSPLQSLKPTTPNL